MNKSTKERTNEQMKTITIGPDTSLSTKMISPFSGLLDIIKQKRKSTLS